MTAASPDSIIDSILAYRRAKVLMVAAYYKVFDHLQRPCTAAQLARRLSLHPRATEIVLDSLTASGYLLKSSSRYRNSAVASSRLVSTAPAYMGDNLKYQEIISEAWQDLRGCLKRGEATRPLSYWLDEHEGFTDEYIRGMANIAKNPAAEIARLVPSRGSQSLLDLGCGPGSYSAAFLDTNPLLTADLFDLPGTLKITGALMSNRPALRGRYRLRPGNYLTDSYGRARYDIALLSHITHDESPASNLRMLRKCRAALRPGGRAVIHDFIVDEKRTAPEFGALFSVHMLAYTAGGRTYTLREYKGWLEKAGFTKLRVRRIGQAAKNSTHIIVGTRGA